MRLSSDHTSVRVGSGRREATNYSETKDFATELINFLTQSQTLYRRLETATRRWKTNLRSEG